MLYEFKTRILFFKLTAFSPMRNKYYASELFTRALTREEGGMSINRRKLEVPRDEVLENAYVKMKDLQRDESFLEFQFEDEVGTGLGPTLEYYALIGKAIKEEPNMWKETSDNSLYPNPLNYKKRTSKEKKKIEKFFELVGTITARSLMDERLIDLPFSVVFWKLVFSETAILDDVETIDRSFYRGLIMIQDLIEKAEERQKEQKHKQFFSEEGSQENEWNCPQFEQKDHEIKVEDLCLTFTLPGSENIELTKKGAKKEVDESNMKEYVR
jgi:E3 ubiquitin-protein ligase TRIP12